MTNEQIGQYIQQQLKLTPSAYQRLSMSLTHTLRVWAREELEHQDDLDLARQIEQQNDKRAAKIARERTIHTIYGSFRPLKVIS